MLSTHGIEDVDCPIAEVPDQQAVAEDSEIRGRLGNAPRSIQIAPMLQAKQQVAYRVEYINIAKPRTVVFIQRSRSALRKGNDDIVAHVLNTKRRVVDGQFRIGEIAGASF